MITRRQFLKGSLMALAAPRGRAWPPWTGPRWPDLGYAPEWPGTPWGFGAGGLAFPAYFLTSDQRRQLVRAARYPWRCYLPHVSK